MNLKYLFAGFLLSGLVACGTTSKLSSNQYSNDMFTVYGVTGCKDSHSGDAVDSKIGILKCKEVTFSYDYGRYGFRGPKTAEESFRQAFDNYHYSKFFELTYTDPKVQKLFKDSVEVIKLHPATEITEKTMFDCSACNAVAHLVFKGSDFYYPVTVSEHTLKAKPDVEMVKSTNQNSKLFKTQKGDHGVVIKKKNHKRTDDYLSITISDGEVEEKKIMQILKSIVMHSGGK